MRVPSPSEVYRWWIAVGDPAEWHPYPLLFWFAPRATDGSSLKGEDTVMRRYRGGRWEYRRMTEREAAEVETW